MKPYCNLCINNVFGPVLGPVLGPCKRNSAMQRFHGRHFMLKGLNACHVWTSLGGNTHSYPLYLHCCTKKTTSVFSFLIFEQDQQAKEESTQEETSALRFAHDNAIPCHVVPIFSVGCRKR